MPLRQCVVVECRQWTRDGSLCPLHRRARKARRNADRTLARKVAASAEVCAICGRPPTPADPLTLDHRVPVSAGGTSSPGNVQAAHRSCNSRKRDRG